MDNTELGNPFLLHKGQNLEFLSHMENKKWLGSNDTESLAFPYLKNRKQDIEIEWPVTVQLIAEFIYFHFFSREN